MCTKQNRCTLYVYYHLLQQELERKVVVLEANKAAKLVTRISVRQLETFPAFWWRQNQVFLRRAVDISCDVCGEQKAIFHGKSGNQIRNLSPNH